MVETMAQGLMEMKQTAAAKHLSLYDVEGRIQYFLDRFYLMRISVRLLIHQHCESYFTHPVCSDICVDTVQVLAFTKPLCLCFACTDKQCTVWVQSISFQDSRKGFGRVLARYISNAVLWSQ